MKILERIKTTLVLCPKWVYWAVIALVITRIAYEHGLNVANDREYDYEEALFNAPYWLEYVRHNSDGSFKYQLTDWKEPTLVALDRRRQKNADGEGYAWCLIYVHKSIPHRKLVFLFPNEGIPDTTLFTKPINTQRPEVQKILQYTRYPECEQGVGIYSDDGSSI